MKKHHKENKLQDHICECKRQLEFFKEQICKLKELFSCYKKPKKKSVQVDYIIGLAQEKPQ